ncbi:hypothetical protein CLU79DRAFT_724065 [Phycomyces nitens]|nr:hypothetical protein CLU79DRAFT_724065 [Phycomyces nitens]
MTGLRGVYVPIPTFFKPNEDLDLEALERHIAYLANTGIAGLIFLGSMGEAVHLSDQERITLVQEGKKLIAKYNPALTLIAGTSAASARQTIQLAKDAASAGAKYALILPPSFYRGNITSEALYAFYTAVADQSPLPVIIYNYPGVCQGVDVDVQTIARLSRHKNIVGVKGTDGNIGKVGYLAEHTDPNEFALLAGSADFFLPALSVGAVGLVPGLGNLLPRACVEVQTLYEGGNLKEASALQKKLVKPDDAFARWHGLPGVKASMDKLLGYGGPTRLPLLPITAEQTDVVTKALLEGFEIERSLA